MEAFANPFTQILFVLTLVVISLSVISIRIQKANKLQKKSFEQSQVRTDTDYSSIGVFFQGGRTLVKCPSCAELISIEAKICKACRTNVEKSNLEQAQKLQALKQSIQFDLETQKKVKKMIRDKSLKNAKKWTTVVIPPMIVLSFGVYIVNDQFFPTKSQIIEREWKEVFAKCSVDDVEITIEDTPDDDIHVEISAKGKFMATEERKRCLTVELNSVYQTFNNKGGRQTCRPTSWFIGKAITGGWENDYASPSVYTLSHNCA